MPTTSKSRSVSYRPRRNRNRRDPSEESVKKKRRYRDEGRDEHRWNLQSYWTTTKLWKLTVVLDYYEAMETYSRIGLLRSYESLKEPLKRYRNSNSRIFRSRNDKSYKNRRTDSKHDSEDEDQKKKSDDSGQWWRALPGIGRPIPL